MARIKFVRRPRPYEVAAGDPAFEAGQVVDLPVASCERWKRRGAAVDAPPEEAKPEPKAEPVSELVESLDVAEQIDAPAPEPTPIERAPRKRKARDLTD